MATPTVNHRQWPGADTGETTSITVLTVCADQGTWSVTCERRWLYQFHFLIIASWSRFLSSDSQLEGCDLTSMRKIPKRRRAWRVHVFPVDMEGLPPFKPILQSIVKMAFTTGLQALASRGQTLEAIKTD